MSFRLGLKHTEHNYPGLNTSHNVTSMEPLGVLLYIILLHSVLVPIYQLVTTLSLIAQIQIAALRGDNEETTICA